VINPPNSRPSIPTMQSAAAASSFLCTLPTDGKALAYHVTVSFGANRHPASVQFTSFVGEGRRSFAVQTADCDLEGAIAESSEALCRIAVGQVVRDHLYDKAREGDYVLDLAASPWEGELRPVGAGNTANLPRRRLPG